MKIKRGMRFEHAKRLDTAWQPAAGQKYADAPHELCEVSSAGGGLVWYRPVGRFASAVADEYEMTEGGNIVGRWLS